MAKKIASEGKFFGSPNVKREGFLQALPLTGGKDAKAVLTMAPVGKVGDWNGDDITVATGGIVYTVFGIANDDGPGGGKTYCTPYSSVTAAP
jgi:hypothetical protein